MKKYLLILVLFLNSGCVFNCDFSSANPVNNIYGKAFSDCKLYFDSLVNEKDYLFIVPESYFVSILDESFDNVYKVQYRNYIGYVLKDRIEICSFIPNEKYLNNITLDIKSTSGTQIWSRPSDDSEQLTVILAGTKNIEYISYIYGDIPAGGDSNLWYYVSYISSEYSTNVYEGYVYSENTTNLSPIKINLENNKKNLDITNTKNIFSNETIKTVIIAIIVIPIILFIVFILHKISKKIQKNTNKDIILNNEISSLDKVQNDEKDTSLKDEIRKLKASSFVKKRKNIKTNSVKYPSFPAYENEDDWL